MRHFSTISAARPAGLQVEVANENDRPGGGAARRLWPAQAPDALMERIAPLLATAGIAPQALWSEVRDWLQAETEVPRPVPALPAGAPAVRRLAPALFVTTRPETLRRQIAALSQSGEVEAPRLALVDLPGALSLRPEAWSVVLVDVDAYGTVGTIFDALLAIRAAAGVPVILLSSQFHGDLTLERLPLCDVSLRMPVAPDLLTAAIARAEVNNLAWRARKARLGA